MRAPKNINIHKIRFICVNLNGKENAISPNTKNCTHYITCGYVEFKNIAKSKFLLRNFHNELKTIPVLYLQTLLSSEHWTCLESGMDWSPFFSFMPPVICCKQTPVVRKYQYYLYYLYQYTLGITKVLLRKAPLVQGGTLPSPVSSQDRLRHSPQDPLKGNTGQEKKNPIGLKRCHTI